MNAENRVDEEDVQASPPAGEAPPASTPEVSPVSPEAGATAEASAAAGAPEAAGAEAAPTEEAHPGGEQVPGRVSEAAAPLEAPRRRSHVAPAHIPLDRIDEDATFQMRPVGELSALATELARLGQLFPVDVRFKPPDRFQVICGFRRVAALRFLKRDRVLARLHTDLSDEDALLMALTEAIHNAPVSLEELAAKREELEAQGRLSPIARDMLERALATEDSLAPEMVEEEEEEVDANELAADAAQRLGDINQDLALLADVFAELDEARRAELLTQLRYSAQLVAYLESL